MRLPSRLAVLLPAIGLAALSVAAGAAAPGNDPLVATRSHTVRVERFVLVSRRKFDDVVASIDARIGHPDLPTFLRAFEAAPTLDAKGAVVKAVVGPTDLMEFMRLDAGDALSAGSPSPRHAVRLLIGNPITMRKMAIHVPDAAAYAPVTVLVDERADGVHLSYDTMSSALAPYGSGAANAVARQLDDTVRQILRDAARGGGAVP